MQTDTGCDRRSLRAERRNNAAAPLARLIKPAHLCLISHLEQVAAAAAAPAELLPSRPPHDCTAKQRQQRACIEPAVLPSRL